MNQFVILDLKCLLKRDIWASILQFYLCTALCRLTLTLRSNGGARLLQAGCRWSKEVYQGWRAEPTFLGPVHCAVDAAAQEQLARLSAALAQLDEEGPFLHKSVWFVPRSNINSLGQFYFSDSCKNKTGFNPKGCRGGGAKSARQIQIRLVFLQFSSKLLKKKFGKSCLMSAFIKKLRMIEIDPRGR